MSFGPCSDWPEPRVRAAVPKRTPLVGFLRNTAIPGEDRLWVALHNVLLTDRTMRLFGCDCAERTLIRERDAGRKPDPRLWAAVEVARQYAMGEATAEELTAAWYAAWSAAGATAEATAGYAAEAAAGAAAWYAAEAAAGYAAEAAAEAAARTAVGTDARYAARAAEREWQCAHLVEMLEAV